MERYKRHQGEEMKSKTPDKPKSWKYMVAPKASESDMKTMHAAQFSSGTTKAIASLLTINNLSWTSMGQGAHEACS
jgi:hypothetical protein